jgi:hypothetical protein
MGRQHTTWISDETWDRLGNIAGESVSKKISNAVKFADPDTMMRHNAQMRQYSIAKSTMRMLAHLLQKKDYQAMDAMLEETEWIWGADVREG